MYRATAFIGTEIPTHLNVLRSNNRWLRRCFYSRPFVFLQHGITYLKRQGKTSAFVAGREGAADYIIASSAKERAVIIRDLLYDESQVLVTGLPQFSQIEWGHIGEASPDIVTILLTWKPYDEGLSPDEYAASSSYQNLRAVVDAVRSLVPVEHIRVLAHPKEAELLRACAGDVGVPLHTGSIRDALAETKLFITDYSSACYNAFYQGAGVLFYQPDLERYEAEVGPLIPDEDEFIGPRFFTPDGLRDGLVQLIGSHGHIALKALRTEQHERAYASINEFCDGKNLERVFQALQERGLL
jgi:hypothetical protein